MTSLRSLASLAFVVISLSGCGAKHYQVCMAASGGGSGCSHTKFTKQGATDLGKLLAAEPIQEDIQVWIIDTRKHKGEAPPEPEVNPDPPKTDSKI